MEIDPEIIFFTHSKIRKNFSGCGRLLTDTLEQIRSGQLSVSDLPLIRVIFDGTKYYSMNNRRLWVMKELKKSGHLSTVVVELRPAVSNSEKRLGQNTLSLVARPILN
ncbi:UNVERIFIED_CONTAM: hypothetical protein HDU68_008218 [Siphonaria sp. JEL0065]|nr:hypothetical protein HDU68_008218 [Siphonaria sp. JEL0065]